MRLREIIICIFCVLAAAGLLFLGSQRLDSINAQRSEMKLVMNEPLENAPPSLAFATVALGAFRGLIVDVLWIRADQLKEEGKFFDAKQLAEWITMLQPRFAKVWDFHGWNMAYNISVTIPASRPQERWQWVRNGYELIRDKGIEMNPKNIDLYRSLAWIFQHKIGNVMDDCHKYYKLQLYHGIKPLLGPETQEYFINMANAPRNIQDVLADPQTAKFISELAENDPVFLNQDEIVESYLSLRQQPKKFPEKTFAVIDRYRQSDTLENFDIFAKAYHLRKTWKFEPELMVRLNETYGPIDYKDPNNVLPLDWTQADVHAMYWAALGLEKAGKKGEYQFEELSTDRIVFHAIQALYTRGKMIVYTSRVPSKNDPNEVTEQESVFLYPDLRFFDRYDSLLRTLKEKYRQLGQDDEILEVPHRNMLKRAVLLFYQAGHTDKALKVYNALRKDYPKDQEIQVSLNEYARARLMQELKDIGLSDATEIITLMLHEGFARYGVHDDDEAYGREKMAKEVYDHYQKEFGDEGVDRVLLPPFNTLLYVGLSSFINDQRYPEDLRMNLIQRIQVERPELYEKLKDQEQAVMQELEQLQQQQQQEQGQQQ
ncbi:MAG: hypothetical protein A2Y10_08015 [Planctomycetes bacterium GWF2_41_51]|nr:MAG: hypothetical protein A2Y10_08015 [Planctomycetes bacterium GWF2_41_51]HBG26246.1 hypothetical protein [Phycisphaerales bacterium]